jgi:hypothetical protein
VLKNASSTSSTGDYVVHLNGVDFLRFRGIGFERTGTNTYCTVVQLSNDADNNQFTQCYFRGRKMPSNSSLGFNYGIGSCLYFAGNADSTLVHKSRLLYGYNGLYGASSCSGNAFSFNKIDTSGCSGIYMTGQSGFLVENNQLNMGDFGANQGHYVSYAMRIENSPSLVIRNNKMQMLAVNGQVVRAVILANTTSTSSAPSLVYNNFIFNGWSLSPDGSTGLVDFSSMKFMSDATLYAQYSDVTPPASVPVDNTPAVVEKEAEPLVVEPSVAPVQEVQKEKLVETGENNLEMMLLGMILMVLSFVGIVKRKF